MAATLGRARPSVRLPSLSCDFFKLTAAEGAGSGETLRNFPIAEGDLVLADRGHSTAAGLGHVAACGGHATVRVNTGSLAQLGHLPKHDDDSAKAWLHGKLLVALLTEGIIRHASAISPPGVPNGGAAGPTAPGVTSASCSTSSSWPSNRTCPSRGSSANGARSPGRSPSRPAAESRRSTGSSRALTKQVSAYGGVTILDIRLLHLSLQMAF